MPLSRLHLTERQVLHLIMFVCFVGFAGALLVASLRQHVPRADTVIRPVVHWIPPQTDDPSRKLQYLLADLQDPSLMSLPSPHGFSDSLWKNKLPVETAPAHPPSPPAYLDTDIPINSASLLEPIPLATAALTHAGKSPAFFPEPPTPEHTVALDHSIFEINDGLEERRLLTTSIPATIPSETSLRPTQVRVAIAADGIVHYAILHRPTGNEAADAEAMRFARALQFAPRQDTDATALTWGLVRFLWATTSP